MKAKILFWIDQSLIQFGIAKSIFNTYECEAYGLIDVTDRTKDFFQKQRLVPFHKVWFYHDHIKTNTIPNLDYLSDIEKKYDVNLWLLACNERIFYQFNDYYKFTDNEILSILEQECRLFEEILDSVKPDFIILNQPVFHHNYLFYKVCKARNINVLILRGTRFGYRCIITDEDEKLEYHGKVKIHSNRTSDELVEYLKNFSIYRQAIEFEEKFQKSKFNFLKAILQFLFISNNTNLKTHYTYFGRTKSQVLFRSIVYSLKTKYRKMFINKNLLTNIDEPSQFIYFPLHIEQERSLLILAPYHTNQVDVIKNIAQSLPVGYKLYIKEHPAMFSRGWRSISIYKQIMNIPNVKLVHPSIDPTLLIKKCSLVITISGTNSLDAAFYQKPSIVLTDTSFSTLPSVYRLKSIETLPQAIKESLKRTVNISDVSEYVDYVDQISFNFDIDGFIQKVADYFFYSGSLLDVEIPIKKMEAFLHIHKEEFGLLAKEFIKNLKIK